MLFREITNEEFINFISNKNTSIYQTPEYGFIMNNQGYTSLILGLINDNNIIAASLVLIRKENGFKYAYAPRGFVLDYNNEEILIEFSKQIIKHLKKKGVMGIKFNPIIIKSIFKNNTLIENKNYNNLYNMLRKNSFYHLGYNNFFEALTPRFEAIIDLTKPLNEIKNNIKKEYKTKIRGAIKNGIKIYKGNNNDIKLLQEFTYKKYEYNNNYFFDCYNYFDKRNMADLYYTKLDTTLYLKNVQNNLIHYEELSNSINEKIINKSKNNPYNLITKKINIDKYLNKYKEDLIEATTYLKNYPNGIITAAILVIKNKDEITILIDSYDKKYKKLNSKHLIIYKLIEHYKNLGYRRFNLGGISGISTKNKFSGLNDFKTNFGADIYEYAGDFELIANKRNYELYRNFVPIRKLFNSKKN